jgi:hypothetical protein
MAKRSFTPGPWIAEEVGVTDMGPDGIAVFEVRTADGHKRICEYMGDGDAQLVASAPALLAALEVMVNKATKQNWNDKYPDELAQAFAAIAAANGVSAS